MKPSNFFHTFPNVRRPMPLRMYPWGIVLVLALGLGQANAVTLIPDRGSLNSLLGDTAITEDFERLNLGNSFELPIFSPCLDSSTIIDGNFGIPAQGPGLVVNGVTFCGLGGPLDIRDGVGHLFPSKVLHRGGSVPTSLLIDFTQPVTALGFNYFPFVTTGTDVSLTIFASDETTVLGNVVLHVFFSGTFSGVSDPRAIGSVQISSSAPDFNIFDTTIDNLTFGSVPQPSIPMLSAWGLLALASLLAGLMAVTLRRRLTSRM